MRWVGLVVVALGGCTLLFDPPSGPDDSSETDGGLPDVEDGGADGSPEACDVDGTPGPWHAGAGSSGGDEDGAGLASFAGACVAACGTFDESFSLGPEAAPLSNEGGPDGYVGLFGPEGGLIWSQRFGDAEDQRCEATAAGRDALAIAGSFQGTVQLGAEEVSAQSARDLYVALLDGAGDAIWLEQIGGQSGGAAPSVAVGGDVYVGGEIDDPGALGRDGDPGGGFVAALRAEDGALRWSALFPRASASHEVVAEAVDAREGAVLVAGRARNGFTVPGSDCELADTGGERVAFLARFDPQGSCLWLEDISAYRAWAYAARFGPGGDVFVAGQLEGPLDSDFGGEVRGTAAGAGLDGFVARYQDTGEAGVASWLWRLGDTTDGSEVRLDTLAVTGDRLYAAGFLRGTASSEVTALTSNGMRDALLVTLDPDGAAEIDTERFGDDQDQAAQAVAVSEGRPALRGYFEATLAWEEPAPLESKGGRDAFTLVLPPR